MTGNFIRRGFCLNNYWVGDKTMTEEDEKEAYFIGWSIWARALYSERIPAWLELLKYSDKPVLTNPFLVPFSVSLLPELPVTGTAKKKILTTYNEIVAPWQLKLNRDYKIDPNSYPFNIIYDPNKKMEFKTIPKFWYYPPVALDMVLKYKTDLFHDLCYLYEPSAYHKLIKIPSRYMPYVADILTLLLYPGYNFSLITYMDRKISHRYERAAGKYRWKFSWPLGWSFRPRTRFWEIEPLDFLQEKEGRALLRAHPDIAKRILADKEGKDLGWDKDDWDMLDMFRLRVFGVSWPQWLPRFRRKSIFNARAKTLNELY